MAGFRDRSATVRLVIAVLAITLVSTSVAGLLHHHRGPDRAVASGTLKAPSNSAHPAPSGPCLLCRTTQNQLLEGGALPVPGDLAAPRGGVVPDTPSLSATAAVLVRSPRAPPVVVN